MIKLIDEDSFDMFMLRISKDLFDIIKEELEKVIKKKFTDIKIEDVKIEDNNIENNEEKELENNNESKLKI